MCLPQAKNAQYTGDLNKLPYLSLSGVIGYSPQIASSSFASPGYDEPLGGFQANVK
jgi:hypothetical protein